MHIHTRLFNYYGEVTAREFQGKYFLCLEDWDGVNAMEISEEFYKAFEKEFNSADSIVESK